MSRRSKFKSPFAFLGQENQRSKIQKMLVVNDVCLVGAVNGVPQSLINIKEVAEVPNIIIYDNGYFLGDSEVKNIEHVMPKRIGYNAPLMITCNKE